VSASEAAIANVITVHVAAGLPGATTTAVVDAVAVIADEAGVATASAVAAGLTCFAASAALARGLAGIAANAVAIVAIDAGVGAAIVAAWARVAAGLPRRTTTAAVVAVGCPSVGHAASRLTCGSIRTAVGAVEKTAAAVGGTRELEARRDLRHLARPDERDDGSSSVRNPPRGSRSVHFDGQSANGSFSLGGGGGGFVGAGCAAGLATGGETGAG